MLLVDTLDGVIFCDIEGTGRALSAASSSSTPLGTTGSSSGTCLNPSDSAELERGLVAIVLIQPNRAIFTRPLQNNGMFDFGCNDFRLRR